MIHAGNVLASRFELRRRIGSGGMGDVYEALDRVSGDVIALKTLTRADGDTVTRFKREFRALQSTAHPNLVALLELIRDDERWFFTMELVRGQHLLEYVRGDVARLRAVLPGVVAGLRALHDAGLVHRDVKPSNVMVTADGRVVILDFGLVTTVDPQHQSRDGHSVGTVEYMAPEQAAGRSVSAAVDWYSVGVMIYEALTGQVPHQGHALQIMIDKQQVEAPSAALQAPEAPGDLVEVCTELLRIEPSQRLGGDGLARRLGIATPTGSGRITRTSVGSGRRIFVGRERELAELAASLERARDRPIVHLVVGESGIGKTELVARFARTLLDGDPEALLLEGRCYERESVPYKAFDGVADGVTQFLAHAPASDGVDLLPRRPDLLVRLFPVFMRIEAIASAPVRRDDSAEPQEQRRRMFGALRALLAAIAGRRRVVISIDDLQWADADSFLLLNELLRGAGAPRLLILATVRDIEGADAVPAARIVERLGSVTVQRTTLGPLSADESRVLAEQLAPELARKPGLERLTEEAGGHPMFLHEILRHVDDLGGHAPTASLDDALWARVALLRPDARGLLEAICVAGAPISSDVASVACDLEGAPLARATASLRVAGLAREVQRGRRLALEPYHDRVREAVQGRLAEPRRRELHARLATALEQGGDPRDPQLLLRHFRLAGLPERAARYAEDAALRSLAAHAFDQAAELWQVALELVPRDREDRRRVQLRLGEALIAAGRGSDAAEVYQIAAEGADRPTRLECQRHVAEQLIISGRIERGVEVLEQLLAEIGVASPSTPRSVLLSLIRHRIQLRLRGLSFRQRHRREIADADILRLDVLGVAATGLSIVDTIRGSAFQTRQLVYALRSGHLPHIARAVILEAAYVASNSRFEASRRLFARARSLEGIDDDPYLAALLLGSEGIAAYFAGELVRANERLLAGVAAMRRVPMSTWEVASLKLFSIFNLRFIGDHVAMRQRYDQFIVEAQQRGDQYVSSTMRRACVPLWLAEDDPHGAAEELARASWMPSTDRFHVQHFHELIGRGEIALYSGETADRARLAEGFARAAKALLLRVPILRNQYDYLRGRLAVADVAPRAAARHAAALARSPSPVGRTWAVLLRAGVSPAGDALRLLRQAAAQADAAGMQLTAAAVRHRIAELEGDEAQAIAASGALAALGVRAPARMAALLVPMATPRRALR